jgi:hypothetical protein
VGWEANTHICDKTGAAWSTFFHDIKNIRAMQHCKVSRFSDVVYQLCQQRCSETSQRLLASVGRGKFKSGWAETISTLFRNVESKAALGEHSQDLINRRPG